MTVHELKIWPERLDAILDGRKTYEVRRYDRPFDEGDTLHLREYNPTSDAYTGREIFRRIGYMTVVYGGNDMNYAVLSLLPVDTASTPPTQTACGDDETGDLEDASPAGSVVAATCCGPSVIAARALLGEVVDDLYAHADGNTGDGCWDLHDKWAARLRHGACGQHANHCNADPVCCTGCTHGPMGTGWE